MTNKDLNARILTAYNKETPMNRDEARMLAREIARQRNGSAAYQVVRAILIVVMVIGLLGLLALLNFG